MLLKRFKSPHTRVRVFYPFVYFKIVFNEILTIQIIKIIMCCLDHNLSLSVAIASDLVSVIL